MSIAGYNITIMRADPFTQSFDVYARAGGYPIEEGDGLYVGNYPILPWQSSVSLTYTPPGSGNWLFIAVPIHNDQSGPFGRLT